jgi:C4-dicarboxylate-specific signal transduction histidine kinase
MRTPPNQRPSSFGELSTQLAWLVRLRWLAAVGVLVGWAIDRQWLGLYAGGWGMPAVGVGLLVYNLCLWLALRRHHAHRHRRHHRHHRRLELALAAAQVLLDLGCLTLLTVWTGGARSPLLGFFVFHMVFASLLLPRALAYAGAAVAVAMVALTLWATRDLPADREHAMVLLGWAVTLALTVYLANRITRGLRAQRRRLLRQNRRIRAMTRDLRRHQHAMVQHEKMVALGQMAAGVTHEIANPLASIDSVLQLAQRRPERVKPETVTTLREQVARIHQIIRQMKAFAHPAEQDRQTLPLNDVVDEALRMVRFDERLKRVTVERQFAPEVGELTLLPQALQQVIVNLVGNALDAMADTPDPRLTVTTSRADGWATVEVADNGHGIRAEHLTHMFEPFFTTKPVGKGTGLGLSISYSLVQKQGGSIGVRSAAGEGTTFVIRLPATTDPAPAPTAPTHVNDSLADR